jgi:hypothetical protein
MEQRQAGVLELSAQGLTQQEIVGEFSKIGIDISQRTISNDLAFLRKDAVEFVKKNREHVAFEYRQALSNFYQLRKEAWKHFYSTNDEGIKTHLYGVIESINNDIMNLLAVGDMIELELLKTKMSLIQTNCYHYLLPTDVPMHVYPTWQRLPRPRMCFAGKPTRPHRVTSHYGPPRREAGTLPSPYGKRPLRAGSGSP